MSQDVRAYEKCVNCSWEQEKLYKKCRECYDCNSTPKFKAAEEALDFYGISILPDGSTMFKPSAMRKHQIIQAQRDGLETPQLRKAVREFLKAHDYLKQLRTTFTNEDIANFDRALVSLRKEVDSNG